MTPHEVIKDSLEKKCLICGVGKPKIKSDRFNEKYKVTPHPTKK